MSCRGKSKNGEHFFKIFVKSSETNSNQIIEAERHKIEIKESASEIYQQILELPSTAQNVKSKLKRTVRESTRLKEKGVFSKEQLFRAALNNDVDTIEKLLHDSQDPDINATDHFGWTSLMIAACEGAAESFEYLLKSGADFNITDRTGNTALSLAQKHKHREILNIFESFMQANEMDVEQDETNNECESLYCPDCKIEFSSKSHQSSTVHLLNCKYKYNTDIKSFGIARSNLGYQLMKKIGWDGQSALGARKEGKLYPIKTVLRKGRTGLGIQQEKAKITHFKANDTNAVHFKSRPRALTRKEILENSLKDKRREQNLRRQLS